MYANCRKCAKCGKTRTQDLTVTYHRFPNPGITNITKAQAWAKYCWPNEVWDLESLQSLYKKSRFLCGRHFSDHQFFDSTRQKLNKFAVPDSPDVESLLNERENILNQDAHLNAIEQPKSRVPLSELDINQAGPSRGVAILQKNIVDVPTIMEQVEPAIKEPTSESTPIKNISNHIVSSSYALSAKTKKHRGILKTLNVSQLSEMTPREVKLYNICRLKLKEISRLRLKNKKNKENMLYTLSDNINVQSLCDMNISNSFVMLLQSQLKNCPKKPKGRRYNLQQKIMALVIYKKSPACYRLLRRMFALPCQSILNKLLNRVPLQPGINKHIFTALKEMSDSQADEDNLCILSFDEMSIRKHLEYNSKYDEVRGFQDHGNHGRNCSIATKAMVFMLAGVRRRWKQPIAFYFSHTLLADRMTVILKEILTECFNAQMNVIATVCDLSTVNIKVLKTLGATTREPYFIHCGHEIVAVLDPPHLLKCTRNLLMKHDVECSTDIHCNDSNVKGKVKWSHIKEFYNRDKINPNFVYAPKLTESHLNPNIRQKMRVKLAAQVFSHSVAGGILAKVSSNELPSEAHATAMFIKHFDDLFDAVNADSADLNKGKKYSTNLTARSPHLELFGAMKKFIGDMKFLGSKTRPPSQDGWIHTINAVERLWANLQILKINSLATRRLNQDPIENCFGCIRYHCGSNYNPTVSQFIAGVKTAIISNLRNSGQKKNCEDDRGILSNNLISFLTADAPPKQDNLTTQAVQLYDLEKAIFDAVEAVEHATPEGQACGYVCGFIFKKLRHSDCQDCRKVFLADNFETSHTFTSFKEYSDKNSLNYCNKNAIQCVEIMAILINNYLKVNAWKINIKIEILAKLNKVDFSFLNKCVQHFQENKNHFKICTFYICMKRFIILKNRVLEDEERERALERRLKIIKNK